MEFYQKKKSEIMSELSARIDGLTPEEAAEHRTRYGSNVLAEDGKKSPVIIFLEQYKDFLVIILIIAAFISGFLGDIESAVVIMTVITINAVLGTIQNIKAEQSLEALKKLSAPTAKVMRNGEVTVIKAEELAVGDILVLEAGDYVCADGRIIENAGLKADESALTGESEPVEKEDADIDGDVPLGDRKNMVYSGSLITYGRAKVVVTGVGMSTEIGRIAALLKSAGEKRTPLQVSLDEFGKKLSFIILAVCAVVFALSLLRGGNPVDAFVFAVALAVAAIPEALSSIVTIVLSVGTQKLARENAVIRKLHAVEGLGSVSVICSDKTGTLTQNKMTVKKLYFDNRIIDSGDEISAGAKQLVIDSVLCSDATGSDGAEIGDPTEIALIRFSAAHDMPASDIRARHPRVGEIPFDSDRKLMSTVHESGTKRILITKGAVDVLLPRIREIKTADGTREFTAQDAELVKNANLRFSENGLRVLAVCEKEIDNANVTLDDENGYTLIGLIAMQDPPRAESKEAVEKCRLAGIRPVMITGDHLITASAIARETGILRDGERAAEGSETDGLSDDELDDFITDISVYARVSPEHKIRIVNAWQRKGYIVAMTGDGVNDAPALKQADVGVAMGITGSEAAKDAAAMVLTDDNFATIVKAVENGRNLYANIQKSIQFLLAGNAAGILSVLYASILALPIPFKAVHLLFINLLTDSLPAIALGSEPHSPEVMKAKPRDKHKSILTGHILGNIVTEGLVIAAVTILAFYYGLRVSADKASTMAFAVLCLSRLVHGFNCKSDRPVWFGGKLVNNKLLTAAFAVGAVLLNAVLFIPPLQKIFSVTPLSAADTAVIYSLAFAVFIIIQLIKTLRGKFSKNKKHCS